MVHNTTEAGKTEFGYNVFVLGNRCFRCEHSWTPRSTKNKPVVCPKCKSPYWFKEKNKRGKYPK